MTDEQAAQLQRSRGSTSLFTAMATGTYSYRYRDVGTDTQDDLVAAPSPMNLGLQDRVDNDMAARNDTVREFEDPSDLVTYRETTAVENGAMTLLSKQVAVEAPTTGAKGRAREREVKRRGGRRVIMPSQGLVDAAKAASPPMMAAPVMSPPMLCPRVTSPPVIEDHDYLTINTGLSYPALTKGGYLATAQQGARPGETLLVGCGPESERRRSSEKERDEVEHLSSGDEHGLLVDGKWRSTSTLITMPGDETPSISSAVSEGRQSERYPVKSTNPKTSPPRISGENIEVEGRTPYKMETLSEENARLREEIAKLKLEKELEENARLKEELARLRRGKVEMEDYVRPSQISTERPDHEADEDEQADDVAEVIHDPFSTGKNICGGYRGDCKGCQREREEVVGKSLSGPEKEDFGFDEREESVIVEPSLSGDDLLWENGALVLGAHSRKRTANRGNRVGASLMSQEVAVEHYAGGKGRAREREEKRSTHYLTRVLTDSEDEGRKGKDRAQDLNSDDDEYRGRLKATYNDAAAAMAILPEDVRRKYGEDRPSRIWREHSQEILVESELTGARGRRREVILRREEPARFMPSQEMRDAAAALQKKSP